jgi:hypothetical protein
MAETRHGSATEKPAARRSTRAAPTVPLRWVYSPGETRLQWWKDDGAGGGAWEIVPNVPLDEAQAETEAQADEAEAPSGSDRQ